MLCLSRSNQATVFFPEIQVIYCEHEVIELQAELGPLVSGPLVLRCRLTARAYKVYCGLENKRQTVTARSQLFMTI